MEDQADCHTSIAQSASPCQGEKPASSWARFRCLSSHAVAMFGVGEACMKPQVDRHRNATALSPMPSSIFHPLSSSSPRRREGGGAIVGRWLWIEGRGSDGVDAILLESGGEMIGGLLLSAIHEERPANPAPPRRRRRGGVDQCGQWIVVSSGTTLLIAGMARM